MLHPLLGNERMKKKDFIAKCFFSAMLTPPPLLLALTMLTMELTPVDMELSDGTLTTQSS